MLRGNIAEAKILPLMYFSIAEHKLNPEKVLENIVTNFSNSKKLVIRSSSQCEDCHDSSNAGHFTSILNVENSIYEIKKAVDEVMASMENDKDEVLVQPMLENIKICGVAFTCDINTLAPYYVINYDLTGKTDGITSGADINSRVFIHYKNCKTCSNETFTRLINVIKQVEKIFDNQFLDIEFAIGKNDDIYIFQVRPIITRNKNDLSNLNLDLPLERIYKKIDKLSARHPNLLGDKAVFGVMPDWNPAEIIGLKPRKLALTLYKELITDNIWAYQRNNYGYRNLRSHPLLISFMGVPFIDVRVDCNSFLPKDLPEKIAAKLVNFYSNKFISMPSYHDKIEFEIVYSCYFLNIENRLSELLEQGFNDEEINKIKHSLLNLTNNIICNENGFYKKDLAKIETLKQKYNSIINSELSLIDKIYWLTEDCKRYGTLPFAGIARAAFIAVQFLHSFVDIGIITLKEKNDFLNSLNTISKKLNLDLNTMPEKDFLKKYGHLRPGTYDILSERYDENFENYFGQIKGSQINHEEKEFNFSPEQKEQIESILQKTGINLNFEQLLAFIKESIEGREYAKFVFTKSLSQIILYIQEFGAKFHLSREDMSYVDFKKILNLYSFLDNADIKDFLKNDIDYNKKMYEYTKAIKLPAVILHPEEIYSYEILADKPNFITLNSIKAEIVNEKDINSKDLKGKVIFIKSADPGYDFLFTKDIGGLVTQFGGANSHMAIRCAELGIPAIIGAGEMNFEKWQNYSIININCEIQMVTGQL